MTSLLQTLKIIESPAASVGVLDKRFVCRSPWLTYAASFYRSLWHLRINVGRTVTCTFHAPTVRKAFHPDVYSDHFPTVNWVIDAIYEAFVGNRIISCHSRGVFPILQIRRDSREVGAANAVASVPCGALRRRPHRELFSIRKKNALTA